MKKVSNSQNFPSEQHYAVILFKTRSVYHEGDERSRTHPGHGYPAHTETFDNFEYLVSPFTETGRLEWEKQIQKLHDSKENYVAFIGQPKVEVTSQIKIKCSDN
jgi:hypothetical protein